MKTEYNPPRRFCSLLPRHLPKLGAGLFHGSKTVEVILTRGRTAIIDVEDMKKISGRGLS
jgi:hypothetical protein